MHADRKKQLVSLIVLAGGASSRMGQDKAKLAFHSTTFLENQISKGKCLGIEDILVSGYRGEDCSCPVIPDRYPAKGPLGGMEACLRRVRNDKSLILGVDIPLIEIDDLQKLIDSAQKSNASAVLLCHHGKIEPLIGVYSSSLADEMEKAVLSGRGSVLGLLKHTGYELYESQSGEEYFSNINDPDSYENLRKEQVSYGI